MTKFLFWNISNKDVSDLLVTAAEENDVDLIILVECQIDPVRLQRKFNQGKQNSFHIAESLSPSARILTRFGRSFFKARNEGSRYTISTLKLPAQIEVLITVIHFPSKLFWSEDSQAHECINLSTLIQEEESKVGHNRTVVVGDFNMNPFEKGLVSAVGLNSTMRREIALRSSRKIQNRIYPYFYNPMWNLFGDDGRTVSGTYYYDRHEHVNFYWNMFDQLLLRPELIRRFPERGIQIVSSIGGVSLVDWAGKPKRELASDHLPIVFSIDLRELPENDRSD